jgi:hypothetical protein
MVEGVLQLHEAANGLVLADRIVHSLEKCSQALYDQVSGNPCAASRCLALYRELYVCIRHLLAQWESKLLRIECGGTRLGRPRKRLNIELTSLYIHKVVGFLMCHLFTAGILQEVGCTMEQCAEALLVSRTILW